MTKSLVSLGAELAVLKKAELRRRRRASRRNGGNESARRQRRAIKAYRRSF